MQSGISSPKEEEERDKKRERKREREREDFHSAIVTSSCTWKVYAANQRFVAVGV